MAPPPTMAPMHTTTPTAPSTVPSRLRPVRRRPCIAAWWSSTIPIVSRRWLSAHRAASRNALSSCPLACGTLAAGRGSSRAAGFLCCKHARPSWIASADRRELHCRRVVNAEAVGGGVVAAGTGHKDTLERCDVAVVKVLPVGPIGRPRQDSNLRTRLRRPMLYPLSYEGGKLEYRAPTRALRRSAVCMLPALRPSSLLP
jgi:hypothetical protein